ncbi:hypothetical protein BCR33DRAFT_790111 [Rhizoclosmatium globosum]|uniref:Uncharacterized protein n=1 Tax=Rhizoclosmatium globosum TaxID=329046 RepID=A0A1Y2BR76_9FUNG|nr:hypothetical protein BCR33DRAFT_790111 [Rhizoclosmatium globosum]|eukprot:ORY36645.1 hypothetical protein BCR33DRAFT_790111 [Rhizoclosmatium globosum]
MQYFPQSECYNQSFIGVQAPIARYPGPWYSSSDCFLGFQGLTVFLVSLAWISPTVLANATTIIRPRHQDPGRQVPNRNVDHIIHLPHPNQRAAIKRENSLIDDLTDKAIQHATSPYANQRFALADRVGMSWNLLQM